VRAGRIQLWLHVVLTVAILGGLVIAASKILHGAEVASALRSFRWAYAAPILILSALHVVFKALWFGIAMNQLAPQLSVGRGMVAYLSGQPATLLPGGITARAALLAEAGVPAAVSSVPILFSSLLDMVGYTLLTLCAALWFPEGRRPALLVLAILLALALGLAIPAVRRGLDRLLGGLMRRIRLGAQWEHFTFALGQAATLKFLGSGVLLTLLSVLCIVFVLGWCIASVGFRAAFPALMLAIGAPTIVGRVTPSPAGAGTFDAALVGLLHSSTGIAVSGAAAALAVFRLATVLYHALLGAVVFLTLWRPHRVQTRKGTEVAAAEQAS